MNIYGGIQHLHTPLPRHQHPRQSTSNAGHKLQRGESYRPPPDPLFKPLITNPQGPELEIMICTLWLNATVQFIADHLLLSRYTIIIERDSEHSCLSRSRQWRLYKLQRPSWLWIWWWLWVFASQWQPTKAPHSCRVSWDNHTDWCLAGRMFVDWQNIWLHSAFFHVTLTHVTRVVSACIFWVSGHLFLADHLSHLCILVLCASCTNSECLWEPVLHSCLRKGLAPLSGARHWQASKMRHHCSCLQQKQHSAKSLEAATKAHDIRLSCQEEIFTLCKKEWWELAFHEPGDIHVLMATVSRASDAIWHRKHEDEGKRISSAYKCTQISGTCNSSSDYLRYTWTQ